IYSMPKPITSTALMMLFERGLVRLEDPLSKYIPQFKKCKVLGEAGRLLDLDREILIHDLLDHTAGLSYGGYADTRLPVDKLYDQANLFDPTITLEEMVLRIAELPLAFQPGSKWLYSMATDVIGRLIEIISGSPLPDFINDKVCKPLGMKDTAFLVTSSKVKRLSTLYGKGKESDLAVLDEAIGGDYFKTKLYLGGSGMVSTLADYYRFAQCVLNKGELEGVRLLGTKIVEYMTCNHLHAALLPIVMGITPMPGMGFGLGYSVMMDVAQSGMMGSVGLHGWGGWANTHFWVDPREQLVGILMMQYIPSGTYQVTNDFRTAVYQAMIDG
ncbi:MAG: beta-lactamase family protein, partial [Anaerolineae bacterium]|nr:beta-lactamase family protein [Anaerolineae bacterium]